MQVQVKVKSTFEGTTYEPGVHEMPDSYLEHWFFLAQVQNGTFVVGPAPAAKPIPIVIPRPGIDQPRASLGEAAFENIIAKGLPAAPSAEREAIVPVKPAEIENEKIIETPEVEEEVILPADAPKSKKGSK